MKQDFKEQLYNIFEKPTLHKYGKFIQIIIFANIFTNIAIIFLLTEPSLTKYKYIFRTINFINVMIFTLEYISRVYTYSFKNKNKIFSPLMIIDLIALVPFYFSFLNVDLSFLRTLRVLRIFKLFRLAKFAEFDNIMKEIFKEKKEEFLYIAISLIILLFTITPLIYLFESKAQPEIFTSMSTSLWWAVITFTTVGYGDMYPVTTCGRILTSMVSFLGIAFYAIPGSIFTSALLEKVKDKKDRKKK